MDAKKKALISIGVILGVVALALIITFVVIFAKGPRDYNEDGSILSVEKMSEVRIVLGDNAIYLRDDFVDDYAKASTSHSCGVHFEGNLNSGELEKIPIEYNKKADGYRVFFDKPSNINHEGISFAELIINYRRHASVHDAMSDEYSKTSTKHRALEGQGMTLVTVVIEDRYGALEFNAKLNVLDSVTDAEFESVANKLIVEYETAII